MTRLALVIFLTSISFGCGKKDDAQAKPASGSAPAPSGSSTPAGSAAPAGGSDLATTKTLEPSMDLHNLAGSLQFEAANRPKVDLTVEKALDALEKGGIALEKRKQYLASTVKGSYCVGGRTKDGIVLSVCEYSDAKAATEGKRFTEEQFGKITPNARRVIKGSTLLAVNGVDKSQDGTVDKAVAIFNGL